jgi:spermidine synthase
MPHLTFPIRGDKLSMNVGYHRVLADEDSDFQRIEILDTPMYGRILLLDRHIQLSTRDEHAYHEPLVQIPLLAMEAPRRALVVGGGDGGVIRELCRDPRLERIDMVEIDEAVIRLCREHLPELSDGAFDDPRVHLHVGDAFAFVNGSDDAYDLIVADSTDVYEDEDEAISEQLFTDDFYRDCRRILSDGGVLVTQADNPVYCDFSVTSVLATFRRLFPKAGRYHSLVPSFGGFSAFCWASKGLEVPQDPSALDFAPFRYLSETTYRLAFEELPFG